jgi:hypothetical protein
MKKPNTPSPAHVLVFIISSFSIFLAGCATIELASNWRADAVAIDGRMNEWNDKTVLIDNGKLLMGIQNDSNFVYLMLSTNDRFLGRKLMSQGLTVWFDQKGGKDKTFGIRFPIGYRSAGITPPDEDQREAMPADMGRSAGLIRELEILGPGKENHQRMAILAAGGIDAKVSFSPGSFVYELKVPFPDNNRYPFSIRAQSGTSIGLGLETPEISDRPDFQGAEGGGVGATGGGRRGSGGRGQGPSGSDPERMREMMEPLKVWMKVQLAGVSALNTK